jgi:hypothetical protein
MEAISSLAQLGATFTGLATLPADFFTGPRVGETFGAADRAVAVNAPTPRPISRVKVEVTAMRPRAPMVEEHTSPRSRLAV